MDEEIIGIFDMENTTVMKSTVDYLNRAEKNGDVNNVAPFELPKSFVVTNNKNKRKIHISPVSVGTILAIGAGIVFLVGIVDGFVRPLKCNS